MADPLAVLWDRFLLIYGLWMPYHPRKWRVLDRLAHKASATWGRPRLACRQGLWWELDLQHLIPRYIFYLGGYERWETRFLRRLVKSGWVVADVGANIGYHSLLLATRVGPHGRVYAFEPAASTFEVLKRNIVMNDVVNVRPYQMALADMCDRDLPPENWSIPDESRPG